MNYGIRVAARTGAAAALSLSAKAELSTTKVYEIDPLCDSRWQMLVNDQPHASVFHSTNWLRALQAAYGYDPTVVTTCPPGAALTNGLVFCRVKSWLTGQRLVSLPFSDHCDPLASNSVQLDDLLLHARQHVDAGKCKYLEIRPTSCQPGEQTGLYKSLTYCIHSLDLGRSKRELFDNFHKSCVQRKIRRAERERLRYEEGSSEDLLKTFYTLLVGTRRRQCLPPQPLSWFRALIDTFGDKLKIRLASKDDSPIASILTLSHKKSMVYKYGCSDVRFNKFGGTALLFWKTIQEAKDKGFEELDMGRSDTDNLGLRSFKEHWGAAGKPISYWTYPRRAPRAPSIWEKAFLRQLVPVTPGPVLRMVGNCLYRHIG
jgi:CelD/BcsL family acetyltransferase involved in cellulose biosynthesis